MNISVLQQLLFFVAMCTSALADDHQGYRKSNLLRHLDHAVDVFETEPEQLVGHSHLAEARPSVQKPFSESSPDPAIETKIVNGVPVTSKDDYPWFATSTGSSYCGASLIHPDIVLTAAHCDEAFFVGGSVVVGSIERRRSSSSSRLSSVPGVEVRRIVQVFPHENYDSDAITNDAMLLLLDSPITTIAPVVLNQDSVVPSSDEVLTVMGYGRTVYEGDVSEELLSAQVQSVGHIRCSVTYLGVIRIEQDIMLCASGLPPDTSQSACQGDSGGPLVTDEGVQVGLVSFGVRCGSARYPGVFARISGLYDWIQDSICEMTQYDRPVTCLSMAPAVSAVPTVSPKAAIIRGEIGVRVHFIYDSKPEDTTWLIRNGPFPVFSGPNYKPGPDEIWITTFDTFDAGEYHFEMFDSSQDGLDSSNAGFEVFLLVDGEEIELLARGPETGFSNHSSTPFAVPDPDTAFAPSSSPQPSLAPTTAFPTISPQTLFPTFSNNQDGEERTCECRSFPNGCLHRICWQNQNDRDQCLAFGCTWTPDNLEVPPDPEHNNEVEESSGALGLGGTDLGSILTIAVVAACVMAGLIVSVAVWRMYSQREKKPVQAVKVWLPSSSDEGSSGTATVSAKDTSFETTTSMDISTILQQPVIIIRESGILDVEVQTTPPRKASC